MCFQSVESTQQSTNPETYCSYVSRHAQSLIHSFLGERSAFVSGIFSIVLKRFENDQENTDNCGVRTPQDTAVILGTTTHPGYVSINYHSNSPLKIQKKISGSFHVLFIIFNVNVGTFHCAILITITCIRCQQCRLTTFPYPRLHNNNKS